jgi:DNA repair protein RecN (Recombination protein N)
MLVHLTIKNYALIKHLEMDPSPHLNVITGETGAGKSIVLGAIGLLLGNRADTKVLWDSTEKCITEGVFELEGDSLKELFRDEDLDYEQTATLRREISAQGKSRAFVNDTPVTLEVLRRIGSRLMDVHSQHETLELGNRHFQQRLIDLFAGNDRLLTEYKVAWNALQAAEKNYQALLKESQNLKQESEFIRFQRDELVSANLRENEEAELESQVQIQEHAEDIKTRFNNIIAQMGGTEISVGALLSEIRSQLSSIRPFSPAYDQLFQRLESARLELTDLHLEIEKEDALVEFDPQRAEEMRERLNLINRLLQKHRCHTVAELLTVQNDLENKTIKTDQIDEVLKEANAAREKARSIIEQKAGLLSTARTKVFKPICEKLTKLLKDLGIRDARLEVDHQIITPGPTGGDSLEILFSANKGVSPKPLQDVASGGEFSRLMFCVKYIMAEKTAMPTLILDEIDNGVSGEIAIQLGNMMKAMTRRHQVIAISHLPQIAAKGDLHYHVYKDNSRTRAVTHIKMLNEIERITEIAEMIGGAKPSSHALENARELLQK